MTSNLRSRPLTVGAVVHELAEEFPDITISKVRFLEAEGLVTPARTASGYRQFTTRDVERLRYVLRAQRDLFWPLKVIKDTLEAIDRGLTPSGGADGRPQPAGARTGPRRSPRPPSSRAAATCGSLLPSWLGPRASSPTVRRRPHLVRPPASRPATGSTANRTSRSAHAAAGLAAYGIEARHLRPFRTAADREVGLVEQAVGPSARTGRGPPGRRRGPPLPDPPRRTGPWRSGGGSRPVRIVTSAARVTGRGRPTGSRRREVR